MNYSPSMFAETEPQESAETRLRIAAVVVTHNRLGQLQKTVKSLLRDKIDRLYVVDNGSNDGTGDWLLGVENDRLCRILLDRNLGGAGGFEAGIRRALTDDEADWLILMDDDARPLEGAVDRFVEKASADEAERVTAAAVYFPDGEICEMNRPSVNPFWHAPSFIKTLLGGGRMGFHIPDTAYDEDTPTSIDIASFVGFFVPVATIRRVGLPDPQLFIYGDDVLYSLRLRKAGVPIEFDPAIRFEHECGTKDRKTGKVTRHVNWKIYYLYRNGILMYRAFAGFAFPLVLPVFLIKWFLALEAWRSDRSTERALFWLAIRDGLMGRKTRPHSEIMLRARLPKQEKTVG